MFYTFLHWYGDWLHWLWSLRSAMKYCIEQFCLLLSKRGNTTQMSECNMCDIIFVYILCMCIRCRVNLNQLSLVANVLLASALMKLIAESSMEPSIRQRAYVVVGQLISKVPSIIKNDLSLLQRLFNTLSVVSYIYITSRMHASIYK